MATVLTTAEIEAVRFHLGWGNIGVGGYPYTPDGYFEAFTNVVGEYLTSGAETTAVTAITAGSSAVVTPASMTGISRNVRLVIDAGDEAETVVVKLTTATTFTSTFAKAHSATGYPIAVESGLTRFRALIHDANKSLATLTGAGISQSAGLKSVGRGAVEWYGVGAVLLAVKQHYDAVRKELSSLVRVPINDEGTGRTNQLEVY